MQLDRAPGEDETRAFGVRCYGAPSRFAAGLLVGVSRASLPALVLFLLFGGRPVPPWLLWRLFAEFAILPAVLAWGIAHLVRGTLAVRAGLLVVDYPRQRIEIPSDAVDRITLWRLPLPGPGVTIRSRAGRRWRLGVAAGDLHGVLVALASVAGVPDAAAACAEPAAIYVRHAAPLARWWHVLAKFPLFALLPTVVFFRAHQHIAYGGTWGEWYLYGPRAYLGTFAIYWTTLAIYLVLYASVWRTLAEGVVALTARVAPARVARVRRIVEIACAVLYYGGVPLLVGLRFVPW